MLAHLHTRISQLLNLSINSFVCAFFPLSALCFCVVISGAPREIISLRRYHIVLFAYCYFPFGRGGVDFIRSPKPVPLRGVHRLGWGIFSGRVLYLGVCSTPIHFFCLVLVCCCIWVSYLECYPRQETPLCPSPFRGFFKMVGWIILFR